VLIVSLPHPPGRPLWPLYIGHYLKAVPCSFGGAHLARWRKPHTPGGYSAIRGGAAVITGLRRGVCHLTGHASESAQKTMKKVNERHMRTKRGMNSGCP